MVVKASEAFSWFVAHPEAIGAAVFAIRGVYAAISRFVAPYPRVRAAVESVAAMGPDITRAIQKLVFALTGRELPSLEAKHPDEDRAALLARAQAAEARNRELEAALSPRFSITSTLNGSADPDRVAQALANAMENKHEGKA